VWNHSASDSGLPTTVVQGPANYITALTNANGTLISSDQDGKIFSWSKDAAPQAENFSGEGHASNVILLTANGETVFSASVDG
jgi:hypothetical protein